MDQTTTTERRIKPEYIYIAIVGALIGVVAVALMKLGNPGNMGFCVACFERDIAGALGLHRAVVVQYLRPEIIGLALGALGAALLLKDFRPTSGSSPLIRFMGGMFSMIGALVFLGCPLRMTIRLGGGDLNALVGLVGFVTGIFVGTRFLKKEFDLGQAQKSRGLEGWVIPFIMVMLLGFLIAKPVFNPEAGGPIFFSAEGPGAAYAPWLISLGAGLLIGWFAQRTRFCTVGGFRDMILFREPYLFIGWTALLVAVVIGDLGTGLFKLGFAEQPIAHTAHIWNFLGLGLVGLIGVIVGGCPLRQLIMSAQGNGDAGLYVLGMIVGGGVAHNFMLAASPKGVTPYGQIAVIIGIIFFLGVGWFRMKTEGA